MADFDWAWPKRIDRAAVEAALRLDFLADGAQRRPRRRPGPRQDDDRPEHRPPGRPRRPPRPLHHRRPAPARPRQPGVRPAASPAASTTTATRGLLVIDEIGYLSYDTRAADLLFQVVSRRYEKRSLVLTTNLAFSDWPTIFPNAGSAIALIDRLIHHAEIITIDGESYRRRVAEAKRKPPRPASEG